MYKNNIKYALLGIILVAIFISSYLLSSSKIKNTKNINNASNINLDRDVSAPSSNEVIPNNATIIFQFKSKKYSSANSDDDISSDIKIEKKEKNKYQGMKVSELEDKYSDKNYKVISVDKSKVVLQREADYFPNSYVVGVSDGFIAIFKTDEDGNKKVQEISKKRIEDCLPYDKERLESGVQFNTLEKAQDELIQLIT